MEKKQNSQTKNPSAPNKAQPQKPAQFPGNKTQPQKKSNW